MNRPSNSRRLLTMAAGLAVAAAAAAGCTGGDPEARGASDFVADVPGGGYPPPGGTDTTGSPTGGTGGAGGGRGKEAPPRLIEEGDVVKLVGSTLYVLNQYRGLQIVDLSDPDRPRLAGRAPLYGRPLEMYVRDGNAYALVSDYWSYWRCIDCEGGAGSFHGSQIAVIDVRQSDAPVLRSRIEVEGLITDSRIVGDVLYTVSNRYAWWYWGATTDDTKDLTFVQSINIANPERPVVVDRLDFPREGWENHIHVTERLLYVAATTSGRWGGSGECRVGGYEPCSRVTAVDISSPRGAIREGKTTYLSGSVQDRWALDWYQDTLRIIAGQWGNSTNPARLRVFRAADATELEPLSSAAIVLPRPETVTATRFDGPRAFVVTFERIDPLWTIDISDPARPYVAGHLETPGWLDYIEPWGDRLIALGHDRVNATDPWSLQVSLYDVGDLSRPSMIARHMFGEGWGWVPGERDDFRKVFRVLHDLGLVLVPFRAWVSDRSPGGWGGRYRGGVQMLDFTHDTLTLRGFVEHPGWVERAVPADGGRILTVSNELVQAVDASDRDRPKLTGQVELSRNVTDIALSGDTAVELAGDPYLGDTKLYVVPASDPNTTLPTAVFSLPAPYGRIFMGSRAAYIVSTDNMNASTRVDVIDLADESKPRRRGSLALPFPASYWSSRGYFWGESTGATQVGETTLVLHVMRSYGPRGTEPAPPRTGGTPTPGGTTPEAPDADFYVIDLRNPDRPVLASRIRLDGASWVSGSGADGTVFYASHYEVIGTGASGTSRARFYLDRIDLSDPRAPVVQAKVNVPGTFLAASGNTVYTVTPRWEPTTGKTSGVLSALYLSPITHKAYLKSQLVLDGSAISGLQVDGLTAATVVDGRLVLIDLSEPGALRVASSTKIPGLRNQAGGGAGDGPVGTGGTTDTRGYVADWAWVRAAMEGFVFVELGSGMLVYDIADAAAPVLERHLHTQGWIQQIRVGGGRAFLASGYYGVDAVELGRPPQ